MAGEVGQRFLPIARPTDFLIEVEKGNVPGHSMINKFGHGNVITTIAPISTGLEYRTPLAATELEFVSDNANDTVDGTGAREITYIGIDADYKETTFTIPTNGLIAVPLPTDLVRMYRWFVSKSGTYATLIAGSHAGILTTRAAGAGETWDIINLTPFPFGQSEIAVFTIPDGMRGYITQHNISVDTSKAVDVYLFARSGIDVVEAPFTTMKIIVHYVGITGDNPSSFKAPLDTFPARTDVGYMGMVSIGNATVSIHFGLLLIEDGY